MKTKNAKVSKPTGNIDYSQKSSNPFIKLIEDKKRIEQAVKNGQPLSSLKDIKFVRPI